jgi:hypothetical protein
MIENITAYGNGGTSLYLDPPAGKPANITINCGNIYNNGSGLEAFLSGTLTLNGVTFNNNGTDFINNGGTLVVNPDYCNPISDTVITPISGTDKQSAYAPTKSINQVSATGGAVELSCELYSGTQLSLPSGDSVYFPCPIKGTATLAGIEETQADLPDGSTFQSGFTIEVTENGKSTDKLSAFATISFAIPAGVDVSSLAILYWNGSEWVEQVGFVSADGLYFQTTVNFTGTFVLVSVE